MSEMNEETVVELAGEEFAESFFAPHELTLPFEFGAATHIGHVRSKNEDHYAVFKMGRVTETMLSSLPKKQLTVADAYSYTVVVADGMGGTQSGELASRLALQTMVELAGQATSRIMKLTDPQAQQIEQRAEAYVQRIQEALSRYRRQHPAVGDMGTTWTSAHLLGKNAFVVHLGDSRAYLLRDQELTQITHDETLAQALIDSGMPPERVQRFGHVLLNSLGGENEEAKASINHFEILPGDKLLLCTDGLSDLVSDEQIVAELVRHPEPQVACDRLIARALEKGGKDNVTVVVAAADSR